MQQKIATVLLLMAAFLAYGKFILRTEGTFTEKLGFFFRSMINDVEQYTGRHESDYRRAMTETGQNYYKLNQLVTHN